MNRAMALTFVSGFGFLLGGCIAQVLWPETSNAAIPITCIGAGMMVFAILFPENPKR